MHNWNKIFEIGSPKTGTTSLGKAFEILGFRHKGWDGKLLTDMRNALGIRDNLEILEFSIEEWGRHMEKCWGRGGFVRIIEEAEKYDAFEDGPWHFHGLFRILDKTFPGSKFILLERDLPEWLQSHMKHFASEYGNVPQNLQIQKWNKKKDKIVAEHRRKYRIARDYFSGRPKDLLVMNICRGDGWEKLCDFLNLQIPKVKFPHLNQSTNVQLNRLPPRRINVKSIRRWLVNKGVWLSPG